MNALTSFQEALREGEIAPRQGELHSDLLVLMDQPQGVSRFTYALTENGEAIAVAIFVIADPIDGAPCFNAGYAVDPSFRSRGLGKLVVQKAFDELTNGFRRAKMPHLHVEAIVSTSNEPSKRLAQRLFSSMPTECTDGESGQPALQYVRQLF
ncbi:MULTISPECIES: GNAT family N-acetyltransferase [Xanthomonas]|uniref:GNAT family N-acetyltransferase n=1 Tax=Xanthomonas TaxID=338 RepID=UPI0022552640|nr:MULTISPECIES: GNAT family N-acetyltransferase [Xanthomonas]MDY4283094.1 GNAT family N-acetyltransferase [Xanthomonas sp. LF06-19]